MADKDINIHVRTPGAPEAKQQLDKVAGAVQGAASSIQGTAPKVEQASGAFSKFIGLLGSLGLLAALATAAKKISDFFDTINKKADETVQKAQQVRQSYEGLFEAAGAFDEKGRKKVIQETESLLIKSGADAKVGYPTIEAYSRQFKGAMSEADYNSGLQNSLSYAARHGGNATPELLQLMRGWNMNTPQQQYEMYRLIMRASEQSGLTDEDMIDLIGRASPVVKSLGWTPQRTISTLSTLAAGEIGRNKTMRPIQILEEYAKDPKKAVSEYPALGNVKMVTPITEAEDIAEQKSFMDTLEARGAQTAARGRQNITQTTSEAELKSLIREIGRSEQERNAVEHPIEQGIADEVAGKVFLPSTKMQEWAAQRAWEKSLTDEQKNKALNEYKKRHGIRYMPSPSDPDYKESVNDYLDLYWQDMTAQQQYDSLIQQGLKPSESPEKVKPLTFQTWNDSLSQDQRQDIYKNYPGFKDPIRMEWDAVASPGPASGHSVYQQHYYNNTYINQSPPDAGPRSNGGL